MKTHEVRHVKDQKKFCISVLVVEDEPEILKSLVQILSRMVENVYSAKNGIEAFECYHREMIDLIISDIDMPQMSGIELLKLVRQVDRRLPFILSTGLKSLDILTEAIEHGISAFLPKPLQLKDLISKVEDIAQNKELEKKVLEEQKKLNTILNHVDSIVVMVSLSEKLLFMNQKFFDIFPYDSFDEYREQYDCICDMFESAEGLIQSTIGDQYWIAYINEHPLQTHHVMMIDKDHNERIFSVSVQSLDKDELYVVTFADVTELQRAKDEAKLAAKMKGEFLANMSHEIRTPMNGILGFTNLLEKSGLSDKQQRYIEIINGSTMTLLAIINDILDFSKLESGKLELELLPYDPIVEMNKLAQLFVPRLEEKNIRFKVKIDPLISECIYIDLLRIQQIISNLLSNAIKFTSHDGEIIFEVILLEKMENSLSIRIGVRDNGIGITAQQQEKIFEAFGQADGSTTRKFGGTGLGLSICSYLVGLMNSSIHVESIYSEGSYFYFDLPVSVCHVEATMVSYFKNRIIRIIKTSQDMSCQEKVIAYISQLNLPYVLQESLQESPRTDVYVVFCDTDPQLIEILQNRKNDIVFICSETEMEEQFDSVLHISGLDNNFSALYNALLTVSTKEGGHGSTVKSCNKFLTFSGKVLVAEDNPTNQLLIREYFNNYNLEADIVENGQEAVDIVRSNKYDLILMDINMPVMCGSEALHHIRANGIKTPIVALTANAMAGDKERFLKEGFNRYLSKPIIQEELESVLSKYLLSKIVEQNTPVVEALETREMIFELLDMELIQKKLPFPKAIIQKLFQSFLSNSDNSLMRLKIAVDEKDIEKIRQASHSLKGVIGNLHIESMRKLAEEMEHKSRNGEINGIHELYADFEEKMFRLQLEIKTFLLVND